MAARPHRSAAHVENFGSGLSPIPWVAQVSAPSHMQSPRRDLAAKTIRRQTVKEPITSYIGLDIHKESIAMAIADADRAAPRFIGTINPIPAELCKAMRRVCTKESTLVVYEAGPCGYGWVRYLRKQGWACDVIAPSRITRKPSEKRIKTDRRDALLLARESRSGNLTSIVVPDEGDEAIRDLSRARADACTARYESSLANAGDDAAPWAPLSGKKFLDPGARSTPVHDPLRTSGARARL